MRRPRLSLALLLVAFLSFGCAESSSSPGSGGSAGGAAGGTAGGAGGSSASGGSSAAGGAAGSGGSVAGGSAGGAAGSGGQVGGAGGTSTGGGGTPRDGGYDVLGGSPGDADDGRGDDGGDDGGEDHRDGMGSDTTAVGTCEDKQQSDDETDIDCGGGSCPACSAGQACKVDGDCRSGKCDAGKCADPFTATGTISQNGNLWKIAIGTLTLEVDATQAARIVTFSIDGTDVLVDNMGDSTGSVFWPAPQADWNANGWPPPDEFQTKPYTPTSKDNVLTMTGPAGTTGISVTKRLWGNVDHQAVTIEYTIKNGGSAEVKMAPWEISRVYPGGLTFFPNAEPPVLLGMQYSGFVEIPFTSEENGALWWKYKASEFTQNAKGGADGREGWAAHVMCGAGLEKTCSKSPVLIKEWPDQSTPAPEEREVEIYADAGHSYVEFEQQGPYQAIPAGGTLVWTMRWLLRTLPSDVAPTVGSKALLDWVRGELL